MISEPELTGGVAWVPAPAPPRDDAGRTASPYDPAGDLPPDPTGDVVAGAAREPASRRRPPKHWVWALGGALAASAVWTAGVAAWDPGHRAPDLHGYHLTGDPCSGSDLQPLVDATPGRTFSDDPADSLWGSALDRSRCSAENLGRGKDGDTYGYSAVLSIELHKKTDPRPEFADRHRTAPVWVSRIDTVHGIGDEAYLLHSEPDTLELDVLHGGAVITLAFSIETTRDGPPDVTAHPDGSARPSPQDVGAYASQMVAAVRNVMADMKTLPRPSGSPTP